MKIDTTKLWSIIDDIFFSFYKITPIKLNKLNVVGKSLNEVVHYYKIFFKLHEPIELLINNYLKISKLVFENNNIKYIDWFLDFFYSISNKYNIWVATSLNYQLLNIILKKTNLSNMFKNNIFCNSYYLLNWENKEEIFKFVIDSLNSIPNKTIIIEDSVIWVMSAKNIWSKVIWIETNFNKIDLKYADYVFKNFSEIKKLFT